MRSRALLWSLAALCLVGAQLLAVRPEAGARSAELSRRPWIVVLGPLRPLIAELLRMRFDASRQADLVMGQLDDAWSVLALTPERVDDFVHFGSYFLFDAVRIVDAPAERTACVRAGLEILEAGRAFHPHSARLAYVEALDLDQLARHAPERLASISFAPGEAPRGRAFGLFVRAFELMSAQDPDRDEICFALASCAEDFLRDDATPAALRAEARSAAEKLVALPDLPGATRASLEAALRE